MILCLAIAACNPFKITDPNDPRFDPMKFKFEDYRDSREVQSFLLKYIPIGTDIALVDNYLVKSAGAVKRKYTKMPNKKIYVYSYMPKRNFFKQLMSLTPHYPWKVNVQYENQKVKRFKLIRNN